MNEDYLEEVARHLDSQIRVLLALQFFFIGVAIALYLYGIRNDSPAATICGIIINLGAFVLMFRRLSLEKAARNIRSETEKS